MSVYTPVEPAEVATFLRDYAVGELLELKGIADGIENTNYFVTTSGGQFVLTLFERHTQVELDYFLELMVTLANHGLPCPRPIMADDGSHLRRLAQRPAALVERLPGHAISTSSVAQCAAVGEALGRIHRTSRHVHRRRTNERGPVWWQVTADALRGTLDADSMALIDSEIAAHAAFDNGRLPRGVIHADLFRDNALFEGERLTGVIDFYAACNDILLYDVAICLNDWCVGADGDFDDTRGRAFLNAYAHGRPPVASEADALPLMLRAAALRFWLSRLYDFHFPRDGEITHIKDPAHFERILRKRIAAPRWAEDLWST
ncbi:MAG: homoserine kinase [Immundisolibacter sp.]|uniref:homoserine kinase n=1 Tax=Immundisolibacter sp. TaxID=1934948 RepID=UPI003EE0A859